MSHDNGFWKVCEALDCPLRIELLRCLLTIEMTEFPCVSELAQRFELTEPAMSVHLKKLAIAGLVSSKRADRRIYYRAFPTTPEGILVISALRAFFDSHPDADRLHRFGVYVHALSHCRRHAIMRCLRLKPDLDLKGLSAHTDIPPQSLDRLWTELDKAHVFDSSGRVATPHCEPEATLFDLTLA